MDEEQAAGSSQTSDPAFLAEVKQLYADPNWGKDPALVARRDALYEKRYGPSKPVSIGDDFHFSDKGSTENPGDALSVAVAEQTHNTEVMSHLEATYGGPQGAEAARAGAGEMVQRLFPDAASRAHGQELAQRIAAMGPKAEADMIATLYKAFQSQGGQ